MEYIIVIDQGKDPDYLMMAELTNEPQRGDKILVDHPNDDNESLVCEVTGRSISDKGSMNVYCSPVATQEKDENSVVVVKGDVNLKNEKRCYADARIAIDCPQCGNELVHDFNECYLSYPNIPGTETLYFCCEECENNGEEHYEFELEAKLKSAQITIEANPSEVRSI